MNVITVIFNPANYKSRLENYFRFRDRLENQKIKLTTIELTFPGQDPQITDALHLTSDSIMWQKERLINYAVSLLPEEPFAWLDADLLLPDGWDDLALTKLETCDFLQLFENIILLDKNNNCNEKKQGIIWQYKNNSDWLTKRQKKVLPHAEPGFGFLSKKKFYLYDKMICGGGDNLFIDKLLDSYEIHHYWGKLTDKMKQDALKWRTYSKKVDYLPIEIHHLWHGTIKNRAYLTRDLIFKKHDFDPEKDITLKNNVYEWCTDKSEFHQEIKEYFQNRKEDQ